MFSTHVILTSGACWGGSEQRLLTRDPADPADPGMNSKSRILCACTAKVARTSLRCNVFLTFSYPSHLKHLLLRVFLEDGLPKSLSKVGGLAERGIKKSKKHNAIAPIAKTPRKVPGRENIDCENTMKMKIANRKS